MREWMPPPGEDPPYFSHSWIPWERITTALSYEAAVSGSRLHQGGDAIEAGMASAENVHVRATLRSYSRGSEKIHIHDRLKLPRQDKSSDECFPVVWIFNPGPEQNPQWQTLIESAHFLSKHLGGKFTFQRKIAAGFPSMVAVIGYGVEQPAKAPRNLICRSHRYDAMALFSPLCWTRKQHAEWCEYSKCRRNPFVGGTGPCLEDVLLDASAHFGEGRFRALRKDLSPADALILTALAYAGEVLTVVAPEEFAVAPAIRAEAARLRKTIRHIPIGIFPEAQVTRMAHCHLVPILEHEPSYTYPPGVAEAIGEDPGLFADMVPDVIRDFHAGGYSVP